VQQAAACSDRTQPTGRVTVGEIARAHGAALRAEHALTPEQQQVLGSLERCRTAALGGHQYVCDGCGYTVPLYNSCRNRHCATCQSLAQHRWLERRRETILPVAYFHLVFTLPGELRSVVAMNRERMFAVMFEAASKTVLTLSRDKKRLGGTPAVTMVLHTWTRDLRFHPHIHAIVSAGAMNEHGQWGSQPQGLLVSGQGHGASVSQIRSRGRARRHRQRRAGGAPRTTDALARSSPSSFCGAFCCTSCPRAFTKSDHYGLCSMHHVARRTLAELRDALAAPSPASAPCVTVTESADTACQPRENAPSPQTWLECLLALTGVDVLRCPRCAHGRLVARPFDEPVHQFRIDTS
jgi:hypothetical protein